MSARATAYLLPFAGGSSLSYRFLAVEAPPELRLVPIELPGRGRRMAEPLSASLDTLVHDAMGQIQADQRTQPHEPYILFGHSMGGLLAWQITCALREASLPPPRALIVSGMRGPSLLRPTGRGDLATAALRAELERLGGSPNALLDDAEMFACFEPILRADFRALDSFCYRAAPPLQLPLTVLLGTEDRVTMDMAGTWQLETSMPIRILTYPGGHFFLHQQGQAIVSLLLESLAERR